jgi:hypothetical protein
MDYLNHNAPLIVGNQCPVCLDEVAQGLICYPGDIVDTCVMASGEVCTVQQLKHALYMSEQCLLHVINQMYSVRCDVHTVQATSMCIDADTLLTACSALSQELTDERARVHASMKVVPVVTAATAPEVSVDITAVGAALRTTNLSVIRAWTENKELLDLSNPQLAHVEGRTGLTADDVSLLRC